MSGSAGARLKALRAAAGLSQRALARRAGTAAETIARLERDPHPPPRIGTVRKLAAALGVRPEELIAGTAAARQNADADGLSAKLRAALARHEVAPGPNGYDIEALTAAIEARGWRYAVEERPPSRRGLQRYDALVFGDAATAGFPRHRAGRAGGETEIAALAAALVRCLGQSA